MKSKVRPGWSATLQTLEGHSERVKSVAFSPDGKVVASGSDDQTVVASGSDDQTVRLWDASTGTPLQTLEGHSDCVNSVAFSLHSLTVLDNWVMKDKENILWLPPDYRLVSAAVWNDTIVIGHSSGGISILQLEKS
ncbi:hypothetical protein HYALB_00011244 [Hymenoscyphus albidus]|uniref:Mitochondrial division protein 1 n=1 Tax=Hymenoscyphus albidus TaxID=595503 RepID=A0A9N9LGE0_9HELO|nr:hypothetical protein HYALB_00011244 [Hymenoscyphus albidus]